MDLIAWMIVVVLLWSMNVVFVVALECQKMNVIVMEIFWTAMGYVLVYQN